MRKLLINTGEIAIGTLLAIGGIWVASMGAQYGYTSYTTEKTNDKVEMQGQKIATLEEQNKQVNKDIVEIKSDIKEILRAVGGRPSGQVKGISTSIYD